MNDVKKVLSTLSHNPLCIEVTELARSLDAPLYIVGGAVRDLLIGYPVKDWDFAGPAAMELAAKFAETNDARVVTLHEDQPTARVPVRVGDDEYELYDFCELRGDDLEEDLQQRDFTINAIACDLHDPALIDPLGGIEDLRSRLIRAVHRENLQSDPLRCLRAYRFYSQLGFEIEPQTREWIRDLAPELRRVAGQRIGSELYQLMYPPRVAGTLDFMDEDGILAQVLPEIEEGRNMPQPSFHHLPVRAHIIETARQMERLILDPTGALPASYQRLEEYIVGEGIPPMLIMAALMHDIGKPRTFSQGEDGRIHFYEHHSQSAQMAQEILTRFAWPTEVRQPVVSFAEQHMRPFDLAGRGQDGEIEDEDTETFVTMSAIRRMFREVAPHELGLVLLALADSRACRGPAVSPEYQLEVELILDDMVYRYFEYKRKQRYEPLLTGQDLIRAGYEPGPIFSEILEAVKDAHISDEIHTKEQALDIAREIARRHDIEPEQKEE
ncbi:MAG: CCA tRNA nucleotidyltransferase [Armatimonadota bacterium]